MYQSTPDLNQFLPKYLKHKDANVLFNQFTDHILNKKTATETRQPRHTRILQCNSFIQCPSQQQIERLVDGYFDDIKNNILTYLDTDVFQFALFHWWGKHNKAYNDVDYSVFMLSSIIYDLLSNNTFPYKTQSLDRVLELIRVSITHLFRDVIKRFDREWDVSRRPLKDYPRDDVWRNETHRQTYYAPYLDRIKLMVNIIFKKCTAYEDDYHDVMKQLYKQVCHEYMELVHAANIIQFCWHRAITNPSYTLCKKRLMKEFNAPLDPS